MSFRISARGVPNFRYQRDNNTDGSDFEIASVLSTLYSMEPTRRGAGGAAYEYISSRGEMTELTDIMGRRRVLEALNEAVTFLAIFSGANNGSIGVSATNSGVLWNTDRFATYHFSAGNNPGPDFIRAIGPILSDTDMNDWGVLLGLTRVLNEYCDRIREPAIPYITIQLYK